MMRADRRRVGVIAREEFRRALETRWMFGFTVLLAGLILALSFFGLAQSREVGFQSFARVTLSLMNLVLFIVPLVGLVLGVTSLTGASDTLSLLLAQPVSRAEVLWGKLIGLAGALTVAQFVGFGGGGVVVALQAGAEQVHGFLALTGLSVALGWLTVAAALCIAVTWPDRLRAMSAALRRTRQSPGSQSRRSRLYSSICADARSDGRGGLLNRPTSRTMALLLRFSISRYRAINRSLEAAIDWLCLTHDVTGRRGSSLGYHLLHGWRPAFPETTGYIIGTLLDHAERGGDESLVARAREMGEWEIEVQNPDGGVMQGALRTPPGRSVAFNTGMVVFGWLDLHDRRLEREGSGSGERSGERRRAVRRPRGGRRDRRGWAAPGRSPPGGGVRDHGLRLGAARRAAPSVHRPAGPPGGRRGDRRGDRRLRGRVRVVQQAQRARGRRPALRSGGKAPRGVRNRLLG